MGFITENVTYDLLGIIATILVGIVAYFKWKLTYWDRVGVPTLNPSFPFGDCKDLMLGRIAIGQQVREDYQKFKEKAHRHGGIYLGSTACYIPVDLEIIKHIIQKDFQHFVNHGNYVNEEVDPLNAHLFNLEDDKWRNTRAKLTPTFTSGKMKMMFQTLADCAVSLKDVMDKSASSHAPIDIKDILARFGTDIIGSVAFGIECNSLKDPDAEFRKYGRRILENTAFEKVKILMQFILPQRLLKIIKYKFTKPDVEMFFMKAIRDTVEYREKNNIYRKDFMHLLLQLKNRGSVNDDDQVVDEHGKTGEKALTMNELAAQAFVFFAAGFDTSSTTNSFALYELAMNRHVQEKLREEIKDVLARHDGKLTYQGIMDMTYMDKVLSETLRKHPPFPTLNRICTQDYTIPGTTARLRKGDQVIIPIVGVHYDAEYYPDPERFDPERFSEENKSKRPAYTWLPFGDGPRICIGLRFGMLQSKVGLATLLSNYKINLNSKTKLPLTLDKNSFITAAEGGIWLDVEKLV